MITHSQKKRDDLVGEERFVEGRKRARRRGTRPRCLKQGTVHSPEKLG